MHMKHFFFGSDQDELAQPAHFTRHLLESRFRAVQGYNDPTVAVVG